MDFTSALFRWHKNHQRLFVWKNTKDPYAIWVSEVILQQTRVQQGERYYTKFLDTFPTVHHLARAEEDHVLKVWQGLGYYSRARNMYKTAKNIVSEHKGSFPDSVEELQQLHGIGPYTAAAIGSFAYDLPVVALEANGYRLLARIFGIEEPIHTSAAKKKCHSLAEHLLPKGESARFNQALMDFGSLICSPIPRCCSCPLSKDCTAFKENKTHVLPVREAKKRVKDRYFHYFVFLNESSTVIKRRKNNDIWKGLYEFPLIETNKNVTYKQLCTTNAFQDLLVHIWGTALPPTLPSHTYVMPPHKLSHQTIHAVFYQMPWPSTTVLNKEEYIQTTVYELPEYAVSKLIENYLCFFPNFVGL